MTRAYANFKSFKTDLEKHVFLRALGEQLPEDLESHLERLMWKPVFLPIRKAR